MRAALIILFVQIHNALGSLESCVHGGNRYKDGEYFRSNVNIIKTENPQQCVQCRCHEGLVICEVEKCPLLQCDTPIHTRGYCCQRCPEVAKIVNISSDVSFQNPGHKKNNKISGCTSNGRYYSDGSVWQPVIGPLGVMSCVQCQCKNGEIICNRYRCKELPCSHPQKEFGQCCRVCPSLDGTVYGMKAECLPKSAELFVFKTPDTAASSTKIEYAFLTGKTGGNTVHSHVWNIMLTGNNMLTVRTVPLEEFSGHHLRLLGATSYRRFRKYSKREERLRLKCFRHCQKKIFRLENSLKIYHVNLRNKCNEDEVDTSSLWQFSRSR